MFNKNPANTAPGLLKFKPPEDPYDEEKKKKIWEVPNILKMQYINEKLSEKEIKLTDKQGVYAHLGSEEYSAKLNAIEVYKMQIEMEAYDAECNDCYIREFRDFLLGKSKYNKDPIFKAKVPWGEHRLLGADIDAYIDAMIDKKLDFDKKIAKMTMFKMAPRNIQDAWLYYVFIVTGKTPPVDLFLKPWDAFYNIPKDFKPADPLYKDYKQTPNAPEPTDHVRDMTEPGLMGPKESCDTEFDMNTVVTHAPVAPATAPTGTTTTTIEDPTYFSSTVAINSPKEKEEEIAEDLWFSIPLEKKTEETIEKLEELGIPKETAEDFKKVAETIPVAMENANKLALEEHTKAVQATLQKGFDDITGKLDTLANLFTAVKDSVGANKNLLAQMKQWRNEDKATKDLLSRSIMDNTKELNSFGLKAGAKEEERTAEVAKLMELAGKYLTATENLSKLDSQEATAARWKEQEQKLQQERAQTKADIAALQELTRDQLVASNQEATAALNKSIEELKAQLSHQNLKQAATAGFIAGVSEPFKKKYGSGVSVPSMTQAEIASLPPEDQAFEKEIQDMQKKIRKARLDLEYRELLGKEDKLIDKDTKRTLQTQSQVEKLESQDKRNQEKAEKKRIQKEKEDQLKAQEEEKKKKRKSKKQKLKDQLAKAEKERDEARMQGVEKNKKGVEVTEGSSSEGPANFSGVDTIETETYKAKVETAEDLEKKKKKKDKKPIKDTDVKMKDAPETDEEKKARKQKKAEARTSKLIVVEEKKAVANKAMGQAVSEGINKRPLLSETEEKTRSSKSSPKKFKVRATPENYQQRIDELDAELETFARNFPHPTPEQTKKYEDLLARRKVNVDKLLKFNS